MNFKKPTYVWYVLYTKVNWEKKILANLLAANIECYLPFSKTIKQSNEGAKWVEEPLFQCYIFVRVSYVEFFKLHNIDGVVRYVSFGGRLQSIPDVQIKNIQILIKEKQKERVLTRAHVAKGLMAEVLVGPLKGIQGELVQISGKLSIVVRVESIGCCVYANILKDEISLLKEDNRNLKFICQAKLDENLEKNKKLVL